MKRAYSILLLSIATLFSCDKYLDVVPDGVPTIENAFTSRTMAEKYLFTCYSYMPSHASYEENPAFYAGDEFWAPFPQIPQFFSSVTYEALGRNNQSIINPRLNYWDGGNGGKSLFQALRDCNIFLENIGDVPGMQEIERKRWIAEVKFLKAYYHYYLVRMYGPIPIIRKNLPISASVSEVQVKREPVDSVFNYITELVDEAIPDLPLTIQNENDELGRITRLVAASGKAVFLVEAASPLFNGNDNMANFTGIDGEPLFSSQPDPEKWKRAADACKEAIDLCHSQNVSLYEFNTNVFSRPVSDTTAIQMTLRSVVTERWNREIIWGNASSLSNTVQALAQARVDPTKVNNLGVRSILAPTLQVVETFYTRNGVPIDEDRTWDYANRYALRTAYEADRFNIGLGRETAGLHFDRENRFYASVGFDGGTWFGQGNLNDSSPWVLSAKAKEFSGKRSVSLYSVTGYWPKKLVHYQNIIQPGDGAGYSIVSYPWPVIRLADLYLLYAEALNEYGGPTDEAFVWIDRVRARAGLKGVRESWTSYSKNPNKFSTKEGLRDIIQQERLIELAFEGHRFWDIRRWKRGREFFNASIKGWDIEQEETALYYRVKSLYTKSFNVKDYFWPIRESSLIRNRNLVQNPGW